MLFVRLTCAVLLTLAMGVAAASATKIVVETEHYKSIKPSMTLQTDSTASGGKCIGVPLRRPHAATETGPADDGHAEYKINVPVTGTYQFWARCWWYDSCGNSFFVLVDSNTVTPETPTVTGQTFKKWLWVPGPAVKLTQGVHTIRIRYREDGAKMDQFLLTTDPRNRYTPVRVERETPQYIVR